MNNNEQYPISAGIVCLRDFFGGKDNGSKNDTITRFKDNPKNKYIIPFYQRPYEWEWKDKELKGLFESFFSFPETEEDEFKINDDYIIFGTIQLNETENGFEIIDGQQRLTSFWLFIKAVEEEVELNQLDENVFEVKNNISEKYNTQLTNYNCENNSRYNENYRRLKAEIETLRDKYPKVYDAELLRNILLDKVLFSLMITAFDDNVQKSIKLFDSLNTTGLDLSVKDVFKIKYFEFIKNKEHKDTKLIFDMINNAYGKCRDNLDTMYQISENDLLDSFKLWIIMNDPNRSKQNNLAKKVKASPQLFFVDDKYNAWLKYEEYKSLEAFAELAETLNQTQSIVCVLDEAGPTDSASSILLSTYELTQRCGYWYFRNFFFVIAHVFRMRREEKMLTKADVIRAFQTCKLIWEICSIIKVKDLRVKDDVLKSIPEALFSFVLDATSLDNVDVKLKKFFNEKDNYDEDRTVYLDEFSKIIKGDIFNNRQCRFLVGLTYLKDCDAYSNKISWKEQKEKLFYLSQKAEKGRKYEIEHIVSHTFRTINDDVDMIVNHIGNLVFLSAKINKTLGKQTADRKKDKSGMEDDFFEKIQIGCPRQNYLSDMKLSTEDGKTDINISITRFLESLQNNEKKDYKDIMKIVKDRDIKMLGVLIEIYNDFVPIS